MSPEELERRFPLSFYEPPQSQEDVWALEDAKRVRARTLRQVAAELQKMHMDVGWSSIRGAASVALMKLIVDLEGAGFEEL